MSSENTNTRPQLTKDLKSEDFKEYYFLKEELKDFCRAELERLEQKVLNKKPTQAQLENENYKEILIANFEASPNQYFTIQELIDRNAVFVEIKMSNQRMSSLLSALVRAGKVEKKLEKKRAYYKLATAQGDE